MTVKELLKEIIDNAESLDQEVDLRAACCDDYEPATHRESLEITNKDGKLDLFMDFMSLF